MVRGSATEHRAQRLHITSDRLLLVEGQDEVYLFNALIKHCPGSQSVIQVIEVGGKDQFFKKLEAIKIETKTRPTFRSVGVVRDADDSPERAFQSVCNHLRRVGYKAPDSHGTFSDASPSVGIFIVPNGTESGAIETLCRRSVEGLDAARCVEQYLDCLVRYNAMNSTNQDKSFAHAYLASMREPVARVGEGAQRGFWDLESAAFAEVLGFIQTLSSQGAVG